MTGATGALQALSPIFPALSSQAPRPPHESSPTVPELRAQALKYFVLIGGREP